MGNIVGEPFKDYVAKQINVRQKIHGAGKSTNRSIEQIQYLNSRNAWVKLASGTSMEQSRLDMIFGPGGNSNSFLGIGLARNFVLFNGVRKLNKTINEEVIQSIREVTPLTRQEILNPGPGVSRDMSYQDGITIGDAVSYSFGAQRSGISSNGAYGLGGNEFGQVPMPGIESVDITNLDRGSIKKATIQLKAHNKQQFDIIDALYLRLGYTILLEYGDSNYFNNNENYTSMGTTLIEKEFFRTTLDNSPYLKLLTLIEKERENKSGNYGGLFGKITNFKWTFNPDGSYSITLDVLSLGDVVESLKINTLRSSQVGSNSSTTLTVQLTSDERRALSRGDFSVPESELRTRNVINEDVIDLYNNELAISKLFYETRLYGKTSVDMDLVREGAGTFGTKYYKIGSTISPPPQYNTILNNQGEVFCRLSIINGSYAYYMKLGSLFEFINQEVLPQISLNSTTLSPSITIDSTGANLMFFIPNMIPLDPSVCIFKSESVKYVGSTQNLLVDKIYDGLDPFIGKVGNNTYGKLANLYINFDFVLRLLNETDKNGDIFLMDFLRSLCDGINESLGRVNRLEPKIYEEENIIRIIDQTPLPGKDNLPSLVFPTSSVDYELNLYGYNNNRDESNFIHNIGLTTEITPEYANMITVGSTANGYVVGEDATAFSKWNTGIIDRFKQEFINTPNNTSGSLYEKYQSIVADYSKMFLDEENPFLYLGLTYQTNTNLSAFDLFAVKTGLARANESFSNFLAREFGAFSGGTSDLFNTSEGFTPLCIDFKRISSNKNIASEFYKLLQASTYEKTKKTTGQTGFLPFNLQLDMDGIEGMKIYNKINIDAKFLASNYPDAMEFVLTGIRHKLENNKWTTSLDSIATVANLAETKKVIAELEDILLNTQAYIQSLLLDVSTSSGVYDKGIGKTSISLNNSIYPVIIATDNASQKDIYKNRFGYPGEFIIREGNNNPDSNVTKFVNFLENWKTNNDKVRIKIKNNNIEPGGELGNGGDITPQLLQALERLHEILGKDEYSPISPIIITAGNDLFHHGVTLGPNPVGKESQAYANQRMAYANAGNVTPATSTHNRGLALDIGEKYDAAKNNLIIKACKEAGFTGVIYHAKHVHANLNPKDTTLGTKTVELSDEVKEIVGIDTEDPISSKGIALSKLSDPRLSTKLQGFIDLFK